MVLSKHPQPWGISFDKRRNFATAEECEYPEVLCGRVATVLNMTMNDSRPALLAAELAVPNAPDPGGTKTPTNKTRAALMRCRHLRKLQAWWRIGFCEPDLPLPLAGLPQPAHQKVSDKRAHM